MTRRSRIIYTGVNSFEAATVWSWHSQKKGPLGDPESDLVVDMTRDFLYVKEA